MSSGTIEPEGAFSVLLIVGNGMAMALPCFVGIFLITYATFMKLKKPKTDEPAKVKPSEDSLDQPSEERRVRPQQLKNVVDKKMRHTDVFKTFLNLV